MCCCVCVQRGMTWLVCVGCAFKASLLSLSAVQFFVQEDVSFAPVMDDSGLYVDGSKYFLAARLAGFSTLN